MAAETAFADQQIQGLKLARTEAEQLMMQKFFLEELTGLHHLHLLLQQYAFVVWEMMALLEHIRKTVAALPGEEIGDTEKVNKLTSRMYMLASSDINLEGHNTDLLAVYRKGMDSCGANSADIATFVARSRRGEPDAAILRNINAGPGTTAFLKQCRQLITSGSLHQQIAALCFAPRLPKQKTLLRFIDQLDSKLPVLLMRIRYYFDLEFMLQEEIFQPSGAELLTVICAADAEKWAASKQTISDMAFARASLLTDVRAAIKRL